MYRQLKRKRTAIAYLFVVSLPVLVAIAVKFGPSGNSGGPTRLGSGTTDLIGLATIGASNFTVTMLYFATPFLLVTVIALFNGDTVASEASWSTLRYLLAAPVPRARLLLQKIKVSLSLSVLAVLIMPISSWLVGAIAFGTKPLQSPLGATFTNPVAISRIAIITVYIAISLMFVAGLAFYLSVRTDAPLGAVGVAVAVSILLSILDTITALGKIRDWLPVHYAFSWFDALATTIDYSVMIRGGSYCFIAGTVFYAFAINRFAHKDVTS
jgi:ABC-2 type transport system permease protein